MVQSSAHLHDGYVSHLIAQRVRTHARAIAAQNQANGRSEPHAGGISTDEATRILQETLQREQEHKQKLLDKRRRRGDVGAGEQLTRAEMDARMHAFL